MNLNGGISIILPESGVVFEAEDDEPQSEEEKEKRASQEGIKPILIRRAVVVVLKKRSQSLYTIVGNPAMLKRAGYIHPFP